MSLNFYLEEEEENNKTEEESISKYTNIFQEYWNKKPVLNLALYEMYILSKTTKEKAIDLTNDIIIKCKKIINDNWLKIRNKYPNISLEDAYIISSYTCESKDKDYSPYKIMNKNLVTEDRKNGLTIISKYFFIFLNSLRKLPRYYPSQTNKYLYRCIRNHINYKIDPFKPKSIPYIQGNRKIFWGFTSTSPNPIISYKFLGVNKGLQKGTVFILYGDIWGYDISLFNYYKEEEILLEPERKFIVENIMPPLNEIISVTCKIEKSPFVLNQNKKMEIVQPIIEQYSNNQANIILQPQNNNIQNNSQIIINNNNLVSKFGETQDNKNISRNFFEPEITKQNEILNKELNVKFLYDKSKIGKSIYINSNLTGLLNLCLMKEIAYRLGPSELAQLSYPLDMIIGILKNGYISQTKDLKQDIKTILNDEKGCNIINYSKYVNNVIKPEYITYLRQLLRPNDSNEINDIINRLTIYENEIRLFNKEFPLALKNSLFEFSVVSLVMIEREDFKRFEEERQKCPNRVDRILFHGTIPEPISFILTSKFKRCSRGKHGEGLYFTDMLDDCWFFGSQKNNSNNVLKIAKKGETFTIIVCSIYYDKTHFRRVYDHKYTPQKNEINFAFIGSKNLETLKMKNPNETHKYFGHDYVINDLNQIFPFISLKLKREEFCVIWRDNNFSDKPIYKNHYDKKFKNFLSEQLSHIEQCVNFNIYPCTSTEEALKLVQRKKFNKIILISNIGKDHGGKIFINEARKIIGNDVVVLFLVYNINLHLEWVTKYKNALITNEQIVFEQYLRCFSNDSEYAKKEINKLKLSLETKYHKLFIFSQDFLDFPNHKDSGKYGDLYL